MSANKAVVSLKWNKILISQPKPTSEKSPYFEIEKKYNVSLYFHPFFKLESISSKEFRKQKIDLTSYTAIIFTSKNAIDHFFRICEELKFTVNQETRYFCISEAVALYLQKFILYRKRKVFFGADGTNKSLLDVISKHKDEKYLSVGSENQEENTIATGLKANKIDYTSAYVFRTIGNDVDKVLAENNFDIISLFTPAGVKILLDLDKTLIPSETKFAAFGEKTKNALEDAKYTVDIYTPTPQYPSMTSALENYLGNLKK